MRCALAAVLCLAFSVSAFAQPVAEIGSGVASLDARLAALNPTRPLAYFELAEEVASEVGGRDGRALARRLFVLAYDLDRASPAGGRLSRSVCLALLELDLLDSDEDRRFIAALAEALRSDDDILERRSVVEGAGRSVANEEAAVTLAIALGDYRAGRFLEAREPLSRPEVRSVLAAHSSMLRNVPGILRDIDSRPSCRECRNRRVVRDDLSPDGRQRLCRTCGGDPSPGLAPVDLVALLRVESLLLSGVDASWGAQAASGRLEPFADVDPARVAERLRVPTDRTIWREGGWVPATQATPADAGNR